MMSKSRLALGWALAAALAPASAPAFCESSDTYWACVTVITECSYSRECTEYYCSDHQETGRKRGYHINMCE